MQISLIPQRFITGKTASISLLSPEFEMAMTTSLLLIMPKSPWLASPGWTKKAGVPVLAKLAAIFRPMCPDLPMPITITFPLQWKSI